MKKKKRNVKILIISIVIVYFVAFLGSLFTSANTDSDWYRSIKPSITPPNFVFPIVWNVLFFLIGLSLYFSWTSSNKKDKGNIIFFYGLNFILNVLWSVFYFGFRNPGLAFFEIIVLWLSILSLIIINWGINKKASWLLVPYLLWVAFASVLNYLSI